MFVTIYLSLSTIVWSKEDWFMMIEMLTKEVGSMMCAMQKEGIYGQMVSTINLFLKNLIKYLKMNMNILIEYWFIN